MQDKQFHNETGRFTLKEVGIQGQVWTVFFPGHRLQGNLPKAIHPVCRNYKVIRRVWGQKAKNIIVYSTIIRLGISTILGPEYNADCEEQGQTK
jgi:hypothetical protein